jgi:hypothetical protein
VTGLIDYRYGWLNGWRWVGYYVRRRRFLAAFRQVFSAYVRGYISESCQNCGRPYFLWHADDQLYGEVTGRWPKEDGSGRSEAASGLFCPGCFDRMAERTGLVLMWRPEVFRR